MMKRFSILLVLLMVAGAAFSNTKIASSPNHKDKMKDGKKVNCAFCHTDAKIEKKKGQVQGKTLNGKSIATVKNCAGAGCHK